MYFLRILHSVHNIVVVVHRDSLFVIIDFGLSEKRTEGLSERKFLSLLVNGYICGSGVL